MYLNAVAAVVVQPFCHVGIGRHVSLSANSYDLSHLLASRTLAAIPSRSPPHLENHADFRLEGLCEVHRNAHKNLPEKLGAGRTCLALPGR